MGTFVHSNLQFLHQINTKQTIKLTMSSSLLSFVLLCIVFVHSATAQDLESSKKYDKALDSKDKGYGMDAPTYDGYKDSKDKGYGMDAPTYNGYKTKDFILKMMDTKIKIIKNIDQIHMLDIIK